MSHSLLLNTMAVFLAELSVASKATQISAKKLLSFLLKKHDTVFVKYMVRLKEKIFNERRLVL